MFTKWNNHCMKIGVNSLLDLSQSVCVCKSDISTLPKRQSGVLDPPISNLKESTILSLHSEETICSVSVLDSHYGYGPFSRYVTVAHSICMVQHSPYTFACWFLNCILSTIDRQYNFRPTCACYSPHLVGLGNLWSAEH